MSGRYSVQGEVKRVIEVRDNGEDSDDECTVIVELTVETRYMVNCLGFMVEDGQRFILVTD